MRTWPLSSNRIFSGLQSLEKKWQFQLFVYQTHTVLKSRKLLSFAIFFVKTSCKKMNVWVTKLFWLGNPFSLFFNSSLRKIYIILSGQDLNSKSVSKNNSKDLKKNPLSFKIKQRKSSLISSILSRRKEKLLGRNFIMNNVKLCCGIIENTCS